MILIVITLLAFSWLQKSHQFQCDQDELTAYTQVKVNKAPKNKFSGYFGNFNSISLDEKELLRKKNMFFPVFPNCHSSWKGTTHYKQKHRMIVTAWIKIDQDINLSDYTTKNANYQSKGYGSLMHIYRTNRVDRELNIQSWESYSLTGKIFRYNPSRRWVLYIFEFLIHPNLSYDTMLMNVYRSKSVHDKRDEDNMFLNPTPAEKNNLLIKKCTNFDPTKYNEKQFLTGKWGNGR